MQGLVKIFQSLNNQGIRYLAVGGIAVIAHGYARLTMDLDLVVSLDDENIHKALVVFSDLGYRPRIPVPMDEFADSRKRSLHTLIRMKELANREKDHNDAACLRHFLQDGSNEKN